MSVTAPVSSTALQGLNRAEERLEKTAKRIARLPESHDRTGDEVILGEELVNLIHVRNSYEANLRVLKTEYEIQGHVIDVLG